MLGLHVLARRTSLVLDALDWKLVAGVFVALSTWARWVAIDRTGVGIVLALGACSRSKEPAVSETTPPSQPAGKTVFDTQLKALDKAKAVNDTVMDAAQRQRAEEEFQAK